MAAGLDFEIEGLEELERDLTKAIQTAPEKAKETLKGIGKDFKNAAKKRANSELKPHERTGSEKNKAIKRKWGTKVIEENVGATALVWNSAKTIARGALSGLVNIIKAPFKLIAGTVKGAINSFKSLNIVKSIFTAVGNAIKKVLSRCGVDMKKFSANLNNIKTRASSIINNLKTIFSTVFGAIGKVVRAAANVIATIFGKKISSTCSTAKAVLQPRRWHSN